MVAHTPSIGKQRAKADCSHSGTRGGQFARDSGDTLVLLSIPQIRQLFLWSSRVVASGCLIRLRQGSIINLGVHGLE